LAKKASGLLLRDLLPSAVASIALLLITSFLELSEANWNTHEKMY